MRRESTRLVPNDLGRVFGHYEVDFSMDTSPFEAKVDGWIQVTISPTLGAFHGSVFLTVLFVMIVTM